MSRINQLLFTNGESPDQIVRALERAGYRMDFMCNLDLQEVYPNRTISPPAPTKNDLRELKNGEFKREPVDFKVDKIIIVFRAPGSHEIVNVYYAQTFV